MIKIVFNPNSNQNTSYKNTYNAEGYLKTSGKEIIPISSEFNGINYTIQTITYEAYEFIVYFRDDLYREFQQIQSSNKITIYETGEDARFLADEFEYIEHDPQPFGKEFWEVKVRIRHIDSQLIETVIDNKVADTFIIWNTETTLFSCNVPFNYLDNIEMTDNLADNFKDRLKSYSKTTPYKQLRLYLNNEDMVDLYDNLKDVNNFSTVVILYKSTTYRQYEIEKRPIGNSLYEIDLKLYSNIEITA